MSFINDLDWGNWLYGMWVAIGTGLGTSASVSFMLYFQKPQEHNPLHAEFWVSAAMIAIMTGGKDFFLYIKQNPAPKVIVRESTKTTVMPSGAVSVEAKVTTTPVEAPPKEEK